MTDKLDVAETLAVALSNTVIMSSSAQGFHWNVKGMDFPEFHEFFAEIYEDLDGAIDPLAENIRKMGYDSPYKLIDFLSMTTIEESEIEDGALAMCRELDSMNSAVIDSLNRVFGAATEANEQGIADFVSGRIDMHRKWGWQLTATTTGPVTEKGSSYLKKSNISPQEMVFATEDGSCPPATQDIALNLENRKTAIDVAMYGPLNPAEPNEDYWQELADEWSVDAETAKQQRCGNCAVFNISPSMKDCISDGLTDNSDSFDAIDEAGELGYCEAFDFKCASARTCRAWVGGGPMVAAGKKTISQTPAPKKDRVKGSKTNPKGSASSGKSKAIKFSDKVEKSLSNKVAEHNEKASEGRKASMGMLKAVYRRGAGAFSTSHRPGMTRDQWAMARVNAFLRLLKSGKPSNPAYTTDNDLLPAAHPRSSKKSNSVITASALVPEERDLANAILSVVEKHGKFNEDGEGVWAGYTPAAENEVASIGVACMNCVFYQETEQGDVCQIISLPIEDLGKCRLAVIPDGLIDKNAIEDYMEDKQELSNLVEDAYLEKELSIQLKNKDEYNTPEEAIFALTEFSGLGYEAEYIIRAAWLRGVKDEQDPFSRAKNLAEFTYDSPDSDLLVRFERGN